MDTESGIKLVRELKQNKLLPKFNVSQMPEENDFNWILRQLVGRIFL